MPNKKDWEEEFREIARIIWRHRNEIEMEDALIGKINSLLAAKDQEIKQVKEEVVEKVKAWAAKERTNHLGYCKFQNGREDCKNCGLEDACFDELLEIIK